MFYIRICIGMAEFYSGGQRSSWKRMTRRQRQDYIRKLKKSYQQGEILKEKMLIQKQYDEEEADDSLQHSLDLI